MNRYSYFSSTSRVGLIIFVLSLPTLHKLLDIQDFSCLWWFWSYQPCFWFVMQFPNVSNLTFAPYTSEAWTSFYSRKSLYTLMGSCGRRTWSLVVFPLITATRIPGLHWQSVALCYHTSMSAYLESCLWDFHWEKGPRFIRKGSLVLVQDGLGDLVFHSRFEHVLVEDQANLEPKTWFRDAIWTLSIGSWVPNKQGINQSHNKLLSKVHHLSCAHTKKGRELLMSPPRGLMLPSSSKPPLQSLSLPRLRRSGKLLRRLGSLTNQ